MKDLDDDDDDDDDDDYKDDGDGDDISQGDWSKRHFCQR